MKNLHILLCSIALLFTSVITAQKTYTVNGESLSLKTEVEGSLTLLWNTINDEYRYFSKKDDAIVELTNTKEDGKYQNEFRQTLAAQTSDAGLNANNVNFTLPSLRKFYNNYNVAKDASFVMTPSPLKPVLRLGGFAGITNSRFSANPTNEKQFQIGADLELADRSNLKRHAMVLRLANTFESSDYNYSAFQASLNYRFKFVMESKFDIYVNTRFVSYTSFNGQLILINEDSAPESIFIDNSGNTFGFPVILGLGADIPLGNGFATVLLDDLVGLNIKGNGEFPINLQLGYKINL